MIPEPSLPAPAKALLSVRGLTKRFGARTVLLEYTLPAAPAGRVGLWSKTDSIAEFDDFTVVPAPRPSIGHEGCPRGHFPDPVELGRQLPVECSRIGINSKPQTQTPMRSRTVMHEEEP